MAMATAVAYLTAIALSITAVAFAAPAAAPAGTPAATVYTNHTVGGAAGWFFNDNTNASSANYSSWATTQTFNLGDYLLFNTNTNQTVIQTYNETTYLSCSTDDASDNDTFQYGGGSDEFGEAETIAVPLILQGTNYYFSDAEDGAQCQQGMAFQIVVNHGLGLPPSLNQPPPPPYTAPPTSPEFQSPPITVQPTGGGSRASAKLRCVLSALLLGGGFILGDL